MRNKSIIAVTKSDEVYDFLNNAIMSTENWNLSRLDRTGNLNQQILREDVDLFILDKKYATPVIQNVFLSPLNEKAYIVVLHEPDEMEALQWIHKGASGFLHKPISEVSDEYATFVIKSIFRCSKVESARLSQIKYEHLEDGWVYFRTYSDISALEHFQRYFAMLYSANLRDEDNRNLYLAVNEVCINAIEWGNAKDLDKNVEIFYKFTPEKVMIRIKDEGKGFDPKIVPNPMELGPLEIVKIRKERGKRLGGYGLALVRKIMDKVEFVGCGNEIYMEKEIEYSFNNRSIHKTLPS